MSVNLPTGRVLEGKLLVQFKEGEGHVQKEFTSLLSKTASNGPLVTAANASTTTTK